MASEFTNARNSCFSNAKRLTEPSSVVTLYVCSQGWDKLQSLHSEKGKKYTLSHTRAFAQTRAQRQTRACRDTRTDTRTHKRARQHRRAKTETHTRAHDDNYSAFWLSGATLCVSQPSRTAVAAFVVASARQQSLRANHAEPSSSLANQIQGDESH